MTAAREDLAWLNKLPNHSSTPPWHMTSFSSGIFSFSLDIIALIRSYSFSSNSTWMEGNQTIIQINKVWISEVFSTSIKVTWTILLNVLINYNLLDRIAKLRATGNCSRVFSHTIVVIAKTRFAIKLSHVQIDLLVETPQDEGQLFIKRLMSVIALASSSFLNVVNTDQFSKTWNVFRKTNNV